ncbi:ankyrin repeat and SOCS box protein 13-like [Amphiura filiformis]|uniref:ankyrin repeat and SOCS box protein 13-like n=1 Tax=Amphiura filiformis TaxID=82378 RepID=UPI003B217B95
MAANYNGYIGDFGEDRTAVHLAAFHAQYKILYELIEMGASVNTPTIDGITPLHEACSQGNHRCARLLIQAGAQINARNIDGSTPLCDAASSGSIECINLLLNAGAELNPYQNLSTALHEAVLRDNVEVTEILVKAGCRLEAMDCHYGTPLHASSFKGHVGCTKILLDGGANVNAIKLHESPLHYAAISQNPELVILLLNYGANLHSTDMQGRRPLERVQRNSPCGRVLQFYEENPMLLSQLCRLQIRQSLGFHGSSGVSQLGLPRTLQSYVIDMR